MKKRINTFSSDGNNYKINLGNYKEKKPEIINMKTGNRPKNQKQVLRQVLFVLGFDVPTGNYFTTHDSVRLMYKLLNNITLTERELRQKL